MAYVLGSFLAFTETFLYNQMRSLRRYRPVVLCRRILNGPRFPWDNPLVIQAKQPANIFWCAPFLRPLARLGPAWTRAIAEHRPSVLHGQYGNYGLLATMYGDPLGLPVVTSFYGFDVAYLEAASKHLRTHWFYILGRRALFRSTAMVLALSRAMRDDLIRLGCPAEKIEIHPNGVDLRRFHPAPPEDAASKTGPITVILCGRADWKKGFEYGFRAVRRAIDAGADLRVRWLPAPGPLEAQLRGLVDELGIGDRVEILDQALDPAEVMRTGDMILCPSVVAANGDKEGVPTVLVEAAATGLPAIASRHGGIPEIAIEGESAFLYPERDVEGLAEGLVRLASNRDLRLRMGEAARRTAEAVYDADKIARRLEEHYDALSAAARGRRAGSAR